MIWASLPHQPRGEQRSGAISFPRHSSWPFTDSVFALILAGLLAFGTTLKWPGAGVLRAALFTGASAPMFLLGILGLIVFYQKLGWVPANGRISVPDPPGDRPEC